MNNAKIGIKNCFSALIIVYCFVGSVLFFGSLIRSLKYFLQYPFIVKGGNEDVCKVFKVGCESFLNQTCL